MPPDSWQKVALGSVANLVKGVSYQGRWLDEPGPRLLGLGTVIPGGGLNLAAARFYAGPVKDRQRLCPGEMFIALTDITQDGRVLGSPARLPVGTAGTYVVTHHVARVEIPNDHALDGRFLFYALQSDEFRSYARGVATGTTVRSVSVSDAQAFQLALPPIEEQRAIASVLGALDDKIELSRRMNETLEALARAIFTSWFVDFDPVRAKAEGRQPVGMDAETAALFPDSFTDSPLGPIPSGWYAGRLGDVVAMNRRSRPPDYPHEEIAYVDIASVKEGRLESVTPTRIADAPSRARRLVTDGDVVWSCVRPNRRSYLRIDNPADNLVVSTGFVVLTPTIVPSSYLYLAVTTDDFVDYLAANADGSAYPAVRPEHFDGAPMLIADEGVLRAFDLAVGPLLRRVAASERESKALAETRDALLPDLISGDVRVAREG